ncbi:DUF1499 domain-containing protein [Hydrogenophaga sp.]|uniref:DUF1499 domain-containing protein n=1 Tax=Hydrogenophaga sp. TaxID=1904254 RepID=UPI0027267F52|nr:DUF1499 domain-containing protein [Hydrogenophaga sp.]MDO9503883.1 DUF1499 domain-containing protein [Hydrogenophaga sp.]MDP2986351.1 DUF1499 domain-containing protein [Hydrogenophaga sp.]MDP3627085.1 DUF1499 domain-containing protein [Hydrogenophaga sp.]
MKIAFYIVLAAIVLALVAAQFGLLSGQRPNDLGVKDGRLKPPSVTRNSVSSQAAQLPDHPQRAYASIDPLPFKAGDAGASLKALETVLGAMMGVTIVEQRADYLYAQAQTRWLKFVDDMEFWANPASGVIELRSASRLGREDFGVNRQRIEKIRAAYLAAP